MLPAESRLLWVGKAPVPANVADAARHLGAMSVYRADRPLAEQLQATSLALIHPDGAANDARWLNAILSELSASPAVAVFLLPPEAKLARRLLAGHPAHVLVASEDVPSNELAAQLRTAASIQPTIRRLQSELAAVQSLNAQASRTLEQMDEEMRLAARLQRDFLPRRLPEVGGARFGVLYRPAAWVSGDIYDIARLDETHVGFYVADVVGHGMPAALLTMFIKKSLQTKRIVGNTYQLVPPHVSLRELNIDICEQNLPSCQFCTAIYAVLDTQSLKMTFARGGHPEPILVRADGQIERLWSEGSLLGIFPDEQFTSLECQFQPGDRLLLYTDGAEDALGRGPDGKVAPMEHSLSSLAELTREEMLLRLSAAVDSRHQDNTRIDDVTVLVMDIER